MKRLSALPPKLAVFPLPATEQTQPAVQFAGKTRQFVSQKHKAFKQLLLLLVAVAIFAASCCCCCTDSSCEVLPAVGETLPQVTQCNCIRTSAALSSTQEAGHSQQATVRVQL